MGGGLWVEGGNQCVRGWGGANVAVLFCLLGPMVLATPLPST
jgi:hypothetical protein